MALTLSKKAMQVKPSSTLAITARVKALKAQGEDIVGFLAGEPDFNTPENINQAAVQAIQEGFTKYTPAAGIPELKEAISKKFQRLNHLEYAPNQIVVSNGGKHSLSNIFQAILNPGDEVIIPAPYWLSYPNVVRLNDGIPVILQGKKENGYRVTAKQLEESITERTKAFILNSPSNPTGMIYTRKELEELAEVIVRKDIFVISDEIYENLIYGEQEHVSIASLGEEIYRRTITCSGLSKGYSMTGWRVGYTGSSEEIAKIMASVQSHQTSNANSIAQKASVEALNGSQEMVEIMKGEFDKRRRYMYERVGKMKYVDCLEPQGAFYVFLDCSEALKRSYRGEILGNSAHMAEILLNDFHVGVIPCADFGCPNHIRLSYAISMEVIEKGLDRIEAFLNEL